MRRPCASQRRQEPRTVRSRAGLEAAGCGLRAFPDREGQDWAQSLTCGFPPAGRGAGLEKHLLALGGCRRGGPALLPRLRPSRGPGLGPRGDADPPLSAPPAPWTPTPGHSGPGCSRPWTPPLRARSMDWPLHPNWLCCHHLLRDLGCGILEVPPGDFTGRGAWSLTRSPRSAGESDRPHSPHCHDVTARGWPLAPRVWHRAPETLVTSRAMV